MKGSTGVALGLMLCDISWRCHRGVPKNGPVADVRISITAQPLFGKRNFIQSTFQGFLVKNKSQDTDGFKSRNSSGIPELNCIVLNSGMPGMRENPQ